MWFYQNAGTTNATLVKVRPWYQKCILGDLILNKPNQHAPLPILKARIKPRVLPYSPKPTPKIHRHALLWFRTVQPNSFVFAKTVTNLMSQPPLLLKPKSVAFGINNSATSHFPLSPKDTQARQTAARIMMMIKISLHH